MNPKDASDRRATIYKNHYAEVRRAYEKARAFEPVPIIYVLETSDEMARALFPAVLGSPHEFTILISGHGRLPDGIAPDPFPEFSKVIAADPSPRLRCIVVAGGAAEMFEGPAGVRS